MKISRGPRTTYDRRVTDSKTPQQYIREWRQEHPIRLNGTIDANGLRHTDLYLEISDDDVVALFNALVDKYISQSDEGAIETQLLTLFNAALKGYARAVHDLKESRAQAERLRDVLGKIDVLVSVHSEDAPSPEALAEAVQTIARHYRWTEPKGTPRIRWVRFDDL